MRGKEGRGQAMWYYTLGGCSRQMMEQKCAARLTPDPNDREALSTLCDI